MKRIAWIVLLSFGLLWVADGVTTEAPDAEAPSGYGGAVSGIAVAQEAEQPETEAPAEPAGEVAPTPQAQPPTAATRPALGGGFSGFAATRRTGRRPPSPPLAAETVPATRGAMGFAGPSAPTVPQPVAGTQPRKVHKFKLFQPATGAMYGPFVMRDGAAIVIGDNAYTIQVVEELEEAPATPEQKALENKLRNTVLPEMVFEEAGLTELLDYLSREGEVNIVVVESVREGNFTITQMRLKNIPLYDAIRYVTEVIGIHFRIDDHAVVITQERPRFIGGR